MPITSVRISPDGAKVFVARTCASHEVLLKEERRGGFAVRRLPAYLESSSASCSAPSSR